MFEQALKIKLRFKTPIGLLTTEDLWDLPLIHLDTLAKQLNKALKALEEEVSFIGEKSAGSIEHDLRFRIVKRIIEVKLAERDAARIRQENSEQKAVLKSILADKQGESLKSLSEEELIARLEVLQENS